MKFQWNTLDLIPVSADIARRETHKMTAAGAKRRTKTAVVAAVQDLWAIRV